MGVKMHRGDVLTAHTASGHQISLAWRATEGDFRLTVMKGAEHVETPRPFAATDETHARATALARTDDYCATGEVYTWTLDTTRRVNTALVDLKQTTTQTTAATTSDPMDRIITTAAHTDGYIHQGGHPGQATTTQLLALHRRGLVNAPERRTDRKRSIKGAHLTAKGYRHAGVPAPQPAAVEPATPVTAPAAPVEADTDAEAASAIPVEPGRGWTAYLQRLDQASIPTLEPATHGHVYLAKVSTTPGARQHYDVNGLAYCGAGTGRTLTTTRWRTDSQIFYIQTQVCRRCAPALQRALTTAADHGDQYAASAITALEPHDPRADETLAADIRAYLTRRNTPAPTPAEEADLTGYGQYAAHLRAQAMAGFAAGHYPPGFTAADL